MRVGVLAVDMSVYHLSQKTFTRSSVRSSFSFYAIAVPYPHLSPFSPTHLISYLSSSFFSSEYNESFLHGIFIVFF